MLGYFIIQRIYFMKSNLKLFTLLLLMLNLAVVVYAQPVTLSFTGKNNVEVDKVIVQNLSQVCKDTVLSGGRSLVLLPVSTGISGNVLSAEDFELNVGPNPFFNQCRVSVIMKSASKVKFTIYTLEGRKVYHTEKYLTQGKHTLQLNPGKGGNLILSVTTPIAKRTIQIHNAGLVSGQPEIRFVADSNNCSLSENAIYTNKNNRVISAQSEIMSGKKFSYAQGDSLQITAYANGYAKSVKVHRPSKDTTYVFPFEVPVLSFAVISDVHFGSSTGVGAITKVSNALKNLSSKSPVIDALIVVGDLTDSGTESQYDQFLSVFNNQTYIPSGIQKIYLMGNHDNYSANAQTIYQNKLGQALDQYKIINGYPFITISQRGTSNSGDGISSYPLESRNFLSTSLSHAAVNYPGKPIFVFTHVAPLGTCYGSRRGDYGANNGWGMPVLTPILKQYPQAVVFSGHSHFPIGDPKSISQDSLFTSINTGSTTYSEVEDGLVNKGIHPEAYENITEGYIVNVLSNGNVQINRWDTYRNEEILPEWNLLVPHDGSRFTYKSDRKGLFNPFFEEDAVLDIIPASYGCSVTFPQAVDDDFVQRYTIEIYKGSSKVTSFSKFSQFYLNSQMPKELTVSEISGLLPSGTYTAKVIANDCFGNKSEPLEATFETLPDTDPQNQVPDRSGWWKFEDSSDMFKATAGQPLIPALCAGTKQISYPATGNAGITLTAGPSANNAALLVPKGSCLKMIHGFDANGGGTRVNEFTLMIDFKVNLSGTYYPLLQTALSNNKDADIFIKQNGSVGLNATGGGYSPAGSVSANTWYRYVLVVKAGQPWKEYLNGTLIYTASGNTAVDSRWSMETAGTLLFADESNEDGDFNVAEIAVWNKALTPAQIANLGQTE